MEIIIPTISFTGGLGLLAIILINLFELINANDIDYIFFTKSKQKVGKMLDYANLFVVNVILIISFVIIFNKIYINEIVKTIFDVIVSILISLIIIIDVFSKIDFAEKLKSFIRKNIDIFAYVSFFIINIYGICFSLYTRNLSFSREYEILSITMAAIIISFVLIFLIILIRDIKFSGKKRAKIYLSENDEKYYIYCAKGKFLMCGTDINSDKADKYKLIKLDEIDNYEMIREKE